MGVSEDSPYGFPTLSRAYVNRIRTRLLLVTDEELRNVKKLPAQVVKPIPVVQMQEIMQNTKYLLDEENITNSTSERFTG